MSRNKCHSDCLIARVSCSFSLKSDSQIKYFCFLLPNRRLGLQVYNVFSWLLFKILLNLSFGFSSECHEAIEIDFDPNVISYRQLLDVFWLHHDPTAVTTVEVNSPFNWYNSLNHPTRCHCHEETRCRAVCWLFNTTVRSDLPQGKVQTSKCSPCYSSSWIFIFLSTTYVTLYPKLLPFLYLFRALSILFSL